MAQTMVSVRTLQGATAAVDKNRNREAQPAHRQIAEIPNSLRHGTEVKLSAYEAVWSPGFLIQPSIIFGHCGVVRELPSAADD